MRNKIKNIIKLSILAITLYNGFFFGYLFIWFACGLPKSEWAFLPTSLLAFASFYVLIWWIVNSPIDWED